MLMNNINVAIGGITGIYYTDNILPIFWSIKRWSCDLAAVIVGD